MAVHSVSEVTKFIKNMFDQERSLQNLLIRGELSNFKQYTSGHCYFTLKDAGASMKCVMFRSRAQHLRFQPANGLKVVAAGNLSVYERDGAYQLYVDRLLPEGAGELALAFEQLKERLNAEGLFDPAVKKKLPVFPKRIGVVTSLSGAVLRDIYRVSKRRNPSIQLILYPVQVQGTEAAGQIARAIAFFNEKYSVDALIVGRGGGSMEDLWAFNEELVVRAIAASRIPVVSAVGHETDFTLADFASDVRAATPSQAAELLVPDTLELARYAAALEARLRTSARNQLQKKQAHLLRLSQHPLLSKPQTYLTPWQQRVDSLQEKLRQQTAFLLAQKRHALAIQGERLAAVNPFGTLQRGYSVLEAGGKRIRSVEDVVVGEELQAVLSDGKIKVQVKSLEKEV